jgi:hypothetical protein
MLTNFIALPNELQALIGVGITLVVSFLLVQVANVWPALGKYLGNYKQEIIVWFSGIVFTLIQGWLDQIPAAWEPVAILVFQLIVAVFAVLGFFKFLANRGVKSLQ